MHTDTVRAAIAATALTGIFLLVFEAGPASADQTGNVQLSEQEQAKIQNMFLNERPERVVGAKFSVSVGTKVPQTVKLVPLQALVGEAVPAWREHAYVFAGDKLAIVDPNTSLIIAVMDAPPAWKGQRNGVALALTTEQRSFILAGIKPEPGQRRTAITAIHPGENVPPNVELKPMPAMVTQQVPELKSNRYFLANDDVVVVGADEPRILAIVER